MASGTITFTASGYLQGKIDWSSTSNGSDANTSTVTTKLYARRTNSSSTSGKSWTGKVKVGSNAQHTFSGFSSNTSISNSWKLFGTYTDIITHNDDGTCSVTISGSVTGPSGTSLADKTSSGSATVTLDTILRASTMTITDTSGNPITIANIGDTIRLNIDRKVDTFIHNIYYTTDSPDIGMPEIVSEYTGITYDWVLPRDLVQYLPTDPGVLYFTLTTFDSEGNLIGQTDQTGIPINIAIPEDVIPTASIGELIDVGGIVPSDWGVFVQGRSKISFDITGMGVEGSTITSYIVKVNGETFTKTEASTITTSILTTSGTNTIMLTVTDSRNRSTTITKDFEVAVYHSPVLNVYSAERGDSSGNPIDDGEYLLYTINGLIADCSGKNTVTYSIGYTTNTGITWTIVEATEIDTILPDQTFAGGKNHSIYFKMEDSLGSIVLQESVLESVFKLVNINKSITAMAIGKKSKAAIDEKLFEIALPLEFVDDANDSMKNYLVDIIYPIGSIYMSVNNVEPSVFLGGTWEQIKDTFLLSAGDTYEAGTTGGEAEHTLTEDETAEHSHRLIRSKWYSADGNTLSDTHNASTGSVYGYTGGTTARFISKTTNGLDIVSAGGGQPHNNMPPYLTVYMWKRTA